jgi:hypothetical protein
MKDVAEMPDIRFALTDEEFAVAYKSDNALSRGRQASACFTFAVGTCLILGWLYTKNEPLVSGHTLFLAAGLLQMGIGIFSLLRPKMLYPTYARRVDVRVFESGLSGELDGSRVTLPWKAIDSVADEGDFLIVRYANGQRAIALPKRAVTTWSELWQTLDNRLMAKHGLIVRPGRKLIVNSARASRTSC